MATIQKRQGESGTRYRVQYSNAGTNTALTGAFTDLVRDITSEMDTNPAGSASTQTFTDNFLQTGLPTNRARFYRVKLTQ